MSLYDPSDDSWLCDSDGSASSNSVGSRAEAGDCKQCDAEDGYEVTSVSVTATKAGGRFTVWFACEKCGSVVYDSWDVGWRFGNFKV